MLPRWLRSQRFTSFSQLLSLCQPKKSATIAELRRFRSANGMNVMAKKSVNKSALVRDYLTKYPEKGPSAIAKQITEEHGVNVTGKFVATVKTKVKQASGSAPAAAVPAKAAPSAAKRKPARAKKKTAPATIAAVPAGVAALSLHIANLKAAAQKLGKDEAKRIIDLF